MSEENLSSQLASLHINRDEAPPRAGRGWILIVLACIAVVGGGLAVFLRSKDQIFAPLVQIGQVSLISPSQADVTLVATGYVVSRKKATIAARTQGRLLRLFVDEGDRVKQGQLVAEIDRADVDAQLAQARADVAVARAKVEEARVQILDAQIKGRRDDDLLQRGAGTKAASDDSGVRITAAQAQLASAVANVKAIQARIRSAQVSSSYTRVLAPFDGTVLRKLAEVGEMVSPITATGVGTAGGIFTIAALDELQVEADVSETQLSKVVPVPPKPTDPPAPTVGAGRGSGAPAEIVLDAFPEHRFRGLVAEVRPTVDRSKATVTVKVRFADSTDGVLPDMSAKVSFLSKPIDATALSEAPKRVVPSDAIVDRDGRRVVMTVSNGSAHAAPVVVKGPAGVGVIEISDGPPAGTQLVRSPAPELRDGSKVRTEK